MEYSDNDNPFVFDHIINAVRKATHQTASGFTVNDRIL